MKKAYIFDFDETLVTTKARIHVYKNGVHIGEMNSKQFNFYKPAKGETLDFSEFKDPELILQAKRYKMWPVLNNVNKAVKEERSNSDIYILTARSPIVKSAIYELLKSYGIDINIHHIITIGDDKGEIDISEEKRKWLKKIIHKYKFVQFFDDDPKNIELAASIKGIKTRLVENMGAPMSTPMSTPGMGNVVPAGPGTFGSGDKFGNTIGGKPYTQGKPLKKKRKKKKLVKEAFREKSDPIKDMGIGIEGLWDYTPEEAAAEIWTVMKPNIQHFADIVHRRGGRAFVSSYNITDKGCKELGFEPNKETFIYLTHLVEKEIEESIKDHTLKIWPSDKYEKLEENMNEQNINPYDKVGMAMAKKMKVKTPFKKGKEKGNQNSVKQKNYEHKIITFDEFVSQLNETQE